MYEHIDKCIQLIEGASHFTKQNKLILLVPGIAFLALVIFILFWGYSLVVAGDMPESESGMSGLLFILGLFAFFWGIEVCIAFATFAIAQGASLWYWIPNAEKEKTEGA